MRLLSVRALVEAQHGVVSRRQLLDAGLSPSAIARRLRDGWLVRLYPGVYAVGHASLTPAGRRLAAVLAGGPGAVASHRTAGTAWGLVSSTGSRWEITIPRWTPLRPHPDIRVYRRPDLRPDEVTVYERLPITSLPRTLLDLAAVLPAHRLRRAVEQAELLELFDLRAVAAALQRHAGRRGAPALRALLEDARHAGLTLTRSDLEARFLGLCLDAGLPRPHVNRWDGARETDFAWPTQRLRVELDGWRWHRSRSRFADDRARDRQATLAGERVLRYTHDDVVRRPAMVVAQLRTALAGIDRSPTPRSGAE